MWRGGGRPFARRFAVALVALVAVLGIALPGVAFADVASGTSGDINWVISDDGVLTFTPQNGKEGTFGEDFDSTEDGDSMGYRMPVWSYKHISDIRSVRFVGTCHANGSLRNMFGYGQNGENQITSIDLRGFDTSSATSMESMFSGCGYLETIDLSALDTSNVTDMARMFSGCDSLSEIDFPTSFDTSKVTNMGSMFSGCNSLAKLDLSNFDTSNVTDMGYMFYGCSFLSLLNVTSFDTNKVTNMGSMFQSCSNLSELDVSSFVASNVTDMSQMFYGCSSLESLDLSHLKGGRVSSTSYMFYGCSSLTSLDLSDFDTSMVKSMSGMFYGCSALPSLDLSSFNTSRVTDMGGLFDSCSSLVSVDMSSFNTSSVRNMSYMFNSCSSLTKLDLSRFSTARVTNMQGMFQSDSSLTSLDLSSFDTSMVKHMGWMFNYCSKLSSLKVSSFDTGRVTNMSNMFQSCNSLAYLDLSRFDTSRVVSMDGMFNVWNDYALKSVTLGPKFSFKGRTVNVLCELPSRSEYDESKGQSVELTWSNKDKGLTYSAADLATNYDGSTMSGTWTLGNNASTSTDILGATVTVADQTWTGGELRPEVTVTLDGAMLVAGTDYTVSYSNNTDPGTATVAITGKGSYTGTVTTTFLITRDISGASVTAAAQTWTGSALTPKVTVTLDGTTIPGDGYDVSYDNNVEVGTATITVTGKGGYTGTATGTFDITEPVEPTDISGAVVTAADQTWTGSGLRPEVTVTLDGSTLVAGTDYDVSYADNIDPGTATVTVTGKGSYTGTATGTFAITKSDTPTPEPTPDPTPTPTTTDLSGATVTVADQTWTGYALTPDVTVTLDGKTLTAGTDYDVAYTDNSSVGIATVHVMGRGDYSGTATATFQIGQANLADASIFVADQIWTGEAIEPRMIVTLGRVVLEAGTDYEASYANNVDPGTATVTITGKGNCTGTATATFRIVEAIRARDLSTATVTAAAKVWTGSALEPDVIVTLDDGTEVPADGYDIAYANNTNVGTATVTVTGKETTGREDFYGTATGTFEITPADLSGVTVSVEDQTWTGSALEPAVTVKLGEVTLVAGTDYDVSYADNINVGTGTVTITGKGNYTGTATVTFEIAKPDGPTPVDPEPVVATRAMFRLYNPNSGEHFYTASTLECDHLKYVGWRYEGVGWTAPVESTTPVYRLYSGTDHHYTTSETERDNLVKVGWRYEGVGWYSDDNHGVPLYRQYNPNVNPRAKRNNSGSHNYTTSKAESDHLVSLGWRYEGIAWYGVKI